HTQNRRDTGVGTQIVIIPTLRFSVFDGATVLGTAEYQFSQSPNAAGGPSGNPPGGVVGPLIEMAEGVWRRTIAWYDIAALEIGLQLDDLPPVTAELSG